MKKMDLLKNVVAAMIAAFSFIPIALQAQEPQRFVWDLAQPTIKSVNARGGDQIDVVFPQQIGVDSYTVQVCWERAARRTGTFALFDEDFKGCKGDYNVPNVTSIQSYLDAYTSMPGFSGVGIYPYDGGIGLDDALLIQYGQRADIPPGIVFPYFDARTGGGRFTVEFLLRGSKGTKFDVEWFNFPNYTLTESVSSQLENDGLSVFSHTFANAGDNVAIQLSLPDGSHRMGIESLKVTQELNDFDFVRVNVGGSYYYPAEALIPSSDGVIKVENKLVTGNVLARASEFDARVFVNMYTTKADPVEGVKLMHLSPMSEGLFLDGKPKPVSPIITQSSTVSVRGAVISVSGVYREYQVYSILGLPQMHHAVLSPGLYVVRVEAIDGEVAVHKVRVF